MSPLVRAATSNDLPQLHSLIEYTDPGLIPFPHSRREMTQYVESSQNAFSSPDAGKKERSYLLILEEDKHIIGTAAICTRLGASRPFYHYRISPLSKSAPERNLHLLNLVSDCHGYSELCTLFLWPRARGKGFGRLLSLARLMLISLDKPRFGKQICATIRGYSDDAGLSPFWEALGCKLFRTENCPKKRLSARDPHFLPELAPQHPIYLELLPDNVRKIIGKCHPNAAPARLMLENQGLRYKSLIDIFDGGPCLQGYTDNLSAIREGERRRARSWIGAGYNSGFISTSHVQNFAATSITDNHDPCSALKRIGCSENDEILFYRSRSKRP